VGTSSVIMSKILAVFKPHLPTTTVTACSGHKNADFYETQRGVISFSVLATVKTHWRFSFKNTNLSKKHAENNVKTFLLRNVTHNFKIFAT